MAVDTVGFRRADGELRGQPAGLRTVAERWPSLTNREREQARREILRDLRDQIPCTDIDERPLFPAVTAQLGDPLIAVSMNYDQLAIRHWMSKIASADVSDTDCSQRLLYGLDALIRVHVWKENELFLALLEGSSPGAGC